MMKPRPFLIFVFAIAVLFSHGYATAAMITILGKSTGSAAKGKYMRNGEEEETTDKQLERVQAYVMKYTGPSDFKADYTIVLKPDKTVDSTKSTVTFDTINFTDGGKLVEAKGVNKFKTQPITITEVTLMNGDPTMIASFKFSSTNWYPTDASGANTINNNGLMGEINLKTMMSSYTASYSSKSNGAVYTYMVMNRPADPVPPDDPIETAGPPIFSPFVPEPATSIMMLAAFVVFALRRQR